MNKASQPFDFSQFVPGFDFLKNLAAGASGAGSVPGIPSLASWVAPTMSVEEVDKRIQELKTVQYWLEQNGHALGGGQLGGGEHRAHEHAGLVDEARQVLAVGIHVLDRARG
ncbi:PhaM family polyhydroxyalkanoate granule multifunctional regulatory protein, partial [Variovorax paradoxus]|uniref:PhaM family polyhydroxyalkanoate granule multifunctional regulatory protein n=1 Tax=Variovorax paradoxus TaxID=34073 RepID=UPI0038CF6068